VALSRNGRFTHRRRRARSDPAQTDLLRTLDTDLHGLPCIRRRPGGYEVYPVVDAIGGTSVEAHRAGLERVAQAGAHPVSWVALACELQHDWAREETVSGVVEIVPTERLLQE
jgi:hypothetical protein